MAVDHRLDIGARLVDLAVDEALEIGRAAAAIDGIAVEIELRMSSAVTRPGAMLRASRKRPGSLSWRALTWPKPSTTPSR